MLGADVTHITTNPGIKRFLRLNSPGSQKIRCPALMYLLTTVLNFHGKTQITAPEIHWFFSRVFCETQWFFEGFGSKWNRRFFSADNYFLLLLSTQNQWVFFTFILFFNQSTWNQWFSESEFLLNFGIGGLLKKSNSRPKLVSM